MAEPWVSLLIGGTLLLIGFGASLVFNRYRIPDFIVLLILGVVLARVPFEPFGPGLVPSLQPILPVFTNLTIAFILFEGGLSLNLKGSGREMPGVMGHILVSVFLTVLITWFVSTWVLGLDDVTGLVIAGAFCGPSGAVVLSFAPGLKLGARAHRAVVLDAVITNVIAVIIVFYAIRSASLDGTSYVLPYTAQVLLASAFAGIAGLVWRFVTRRWASLKFLYVATLALAIVIYALANGFIGENGAVAAFVFGLVLAYRRPDAPPAEKSLSDGLQTFQSEITFGMRTFFFVYLGLLMTFDQATLYGLIGGLLLTLGFVAARAPSSLVLGRLAGMTHRETRVLLGTIARGMTDVVLVLLAIEGGVIPVSAQPLVVGLVTMTVLVATIVCAAFVVWADRSTKEPREEAAEPAPEVPSPEEERGTDGVDRSGGPAAPPPKAVPRPPPRQKGDPPRR